MVKMTFTFDEDTVQRLRQVSERLDRPQSWVVREAVAEYAARVGKLSEKERLQKLAVFDALVSGHPTRTAAAVDAEIRALRTARRRGGRSGGGKQP